jgi:hypothetical protein
MVRLVRLGSAELMARGVLLFSACRSWSRAFSESIKRFMKNWQRGDRRGDFIRQRMQQSSASMGTAAGKTQLLIRSR